MKLRLVDLETLTAGNRPTPTGDSDNHYVSFGTFTMDQSGLRVQTMKGRGEKAVAETVWVSAPFEILGRVRDPNGDGWAKLLQFDDPDGRIHQYAVPDAALHGEPGALASELASRGLTISREARAHLARYLNLAEVDRRVTRVQQTGWHLIGSTWCFVLPSEVINEPTAETVILDGALGGLYERQGSLQDWQQGIGSLVSGHTRAVLAVSAAFAGPLLTPLRMDGGGIHLFGSSSRGKTTIQRAAASVWGRGGTDPGFIRSWRATANAQEASAAQVTDTLLALDEVGVAEGKDAATTIYQLTAGVGKGRSDRDGSLRSPKTWRVAVFSTGEIPMATKIAEDRGRRAFAGQSVRFLDIPADARRGFGVFDHPGSSGDSSKLAEAIKHAAITSYGTAGPEFVKRVIAEGWEDVSSVVREMIAEFCEVALPPGADGQVKRAAERLGLIGAAGELAREWGIVPWREGEAMEAAHQILREWIAARGGTSAAEEREAIAQVRRFFESHGEARFEPLDTGNDDDDSDVDAPRVFNRLGWRRGDGPYRRWLVLPEVWRTEICSGLDPIATARVLSAHGMLKRDEAGQKFVRAERTPYGTKRVYVVTADILEGDSDEP